MMHFRQSLSRTLIVAATALFATSAFAQAELKIMAPAAPGGGWDQTARAMQATLRATGLAANAQVVNTAGAAGTIGLARFVNSEAGNADALLVTGLVMVSGIAANHSPVTLADVTPIARLSGEYEVIVGAQPAVIPVPPALWLFSSALLFTLRRPTNNKSANA